MRALAVREKPTPRKSDNKLVLIVEDNDLNLKLFRDLLEAHSYTVVETRSGLEVPELVRKHRPDIIIMDIQLPQISGIDIIRSLKGDRDMRNIPVIAVTAFAMQDDEDNIMASGCEAYLAKPISIESFVDTVQKYTH